MGVCSVVFCSWSRGTDRPSIRQTLACQATVAIVLSTSAFAGTLFSPGRGRLNLEAEHDETATESSGASSGRAWLQHEVSLCSELCSIGCCTHAMLWLHQPGLEALLVQTQNYRKKDAALSAIRSSLPTLLMELLGSSTCPPFLCHKMGQARDRSSTGNLLHRLALLLRSRSAL